MNRAAGAGVFDDDVDADDPWPAHPGGAQAIQLANTAVGPITGIPPRPWAYGRFLLTGSAAVIGAMDGAGKGMMAVAVALSFITGKPLLGEKVWRPGPVAILTYEDDETEWSRRFAAACLHYGLDYETVMRDVWFVSKAGGRVVLASTGDGGMVFLDSTAIVLHLKGAGIALWIIDPFNNAHAMGDGNSNVLVAAVAQEISTIARAASVAVMLLHHLHKGAIGGVDDLMGAVALRANFRACRILSVMDAETAGQLGIPPEEAWRYLRIAGSKENYAPPLDKAVWFRKVSIELGNGDAAYPDGDEVGVVAPWQPPGAFDGLDYYTLRAIFAAIAATPHAESKRARAIPWVGKPLIDRRVSEARAGTIIAQWIKNDVLVPGEPFKSGKGDVSQTLIPDPEKVAAILAPMAPPDGAGGGS
jgi:hypothetical protein